MMMFRLIATALAALCVAATAHAQSPIKIGFISTFSGQAGNLGQDIYDGFMLAVEQNGGEVGDGPVQILKEDDQFKPDVGGQAAQKLIEKENVSIITGVAVSNVLKVIYRPVTERQVLLIGSNGGLSPIAGAQCSPFLFVASWPVDGFAEVIGKYAMDKGYKDVLLIAPNYRGGTDALSGFKRFYKGAIADEFYTSLTQPDFSTEIAQIVSSKPEAVYAYFPVRLGVNFVRRCQQAGLLKALPMLTSGVVDGTTLPSLKETAHGILGEQFGAPDTNNPVRGQIVNAFENTYARVPSKFAAQSDDSALLLDSAIAKVRGNVSDKPAFMAALSQGSSKLLRVTRKFNNNHIPINDWYVFEVAKDARDAAA